MNTFHESVQIGTDGQTMRGPQLTAIAVGLAVLVGVAAIAIPFAQAPETSAPRTLTAADADDGWLAAVTAANAQRRLYEARPSVTSDGWLAAVTAANAQRRLYEVRPSVTSDGWLAAVTAANAQRRLYEARSAGNGD